MHLALWPSGLDGVGGPGAAGRRILAGQGGPGARAWRQQGEEGGWARLPGESGPGPRGLSPGGPRPTADIVPATRHLSSFLPSPLWLCVPLPCLRLEVPASHHISWYAVPFRELRTRLRS